MRKWRLRQPRKFEPRQCKNCKQPFTPCVAVQQLCGPCGKEHRRQANIEYQKSRRNGIRQGTYSPKPKPETKTEPKPAASPVTQNGQDEYDDLDRRMDEWWDRMYGNYTASVSRARKSAIGDI